VNGVTLQYEIEGSGKPLVLIHGWAVHRGFWDGDEGRFAPHYTVIRYDRRGFGASSGKPDLTADPADLKALLETLGHRRATIMGHSQGAAVALTFAVRYPEMVDALILYGAGPPAGFGSPSCERLAPSSAPALKRVNAAAGCSRPTGGKT
jgi:pimeloyl-ACP methyl ester carboxylesterase